MLTHFGQIFHVGLPSNTYYPLIYYSVPSDLQDPYSSTAMNNMHSHMDVLQKGNIVEVFCTEMCGTCVKVVLFQFQLNKSGKC